MGDLASKRESTQSEQIENHQIAQQGQTNLGAHVVGNQNTFNVTTLDKEVATSAIEGAKSVASQVINSSYQSVIYTLDALKELQHDANMTTQTAVASAQEIAERAAPVSPGSYAEAIGGQSAQFNKQILYVTAAGIAAIALIVFLSRK
jgi:methylglyoxal synthase